MNGHKNKNNRHPLVFWMNDAWKDPFCWHEHEHTLFECMGTNFLLLNAWALTFFEWMDIHFPVVSLKKKKKIIIIIKKKKKLLIECMGIRISLKQIFTLYNIDKTVILKKNLKRFARGAGVVPQLSPFSTQGPGQNIFLFLPLFFSFSPLFFFFRWIRMILVLRQLT